MSKIVTLTVTVPADDSVLVDDAKQALLRILGEAGIVSAPERNAEAETLPGIPARMFFMAAGVKLGRVVSAAPRAASARGAKGRVAAVEVRGADAAE